MNFSESGDLVTPIYVSSGAFIGRVNGRNPRPFLENAHTLGADGFEFMMYDSWYEHLSDILSMFREKRLSFPVLHVEKNIGGIVGLGEDGWHDEAIRRFETNCRVALEIGSPKLVYHLWNGLVSDSHIERNFSIYGELKEIAEKHGLCLTIENVVCANSSPLAHLSSLTNIDSKVLFTFDTKMANFHRELSLVSDGFFDYLLKNRIAHLHINDHKGPYHDFSFLRTRHIGCGEIDFDAFFSRMKALDVHTSITLECTSMREDGTLDFDSMRESVSRARTLAARYGI